MNIDFTNAQVGVIGLGYVGLPLAVEFGKKRPTLGFDIKEGRVKELNDGIDATLEVDKSELSEAQHLRFTCDPGELKSCSVYICLLYTSPSPRDV